MYQRPYIQYIRSLIVLRVVGGLKGLLILYHATGVGRPLIRVLCVTRDGAVLPWCQMLLDYELVLTIKRPLILVLCVAEGEG